MMQVGKSGINEITFKTKFCHGTYETIYICYTDLRNMSDNLDTL